jgi:hypothetical protein
MTQRLCSDHAWATGEISPIFATLLLLAMGVFLGARSKAAEVASFQAGSGSGWHLGTLGAGNLDGDPLLEIVVPYRDASGQWFLDAFKPNGVRLPGFPYAGGGEEINVSPTLFDLDNDGRDEIIFTRSHRVIALRGDGSIVWSNAVTRANYVPDGGYMTVTNGFYWSKVLVQGWGMAFPASGECGFLFTSGQPDGRGYQRRWSQ